MNTICKECGTENEKEYKYCKNCGAVLEKEQPKTTPQPTNNFSNSNTYNDFFYDGISQEEMTLFVGKKSNEILPKFQKMKLTDSKVSWCWPLAILSLFFGPFGAALWFFYRKIYKHAFIFSGIGFLLSVIVTALNFNQTDALTDKITDALMSGDFQNFLNILGNTKIADSALTLVASSLQSVFEIVTTVVTGVFGYSIYMNHCIEKIKDYKFRHTDQRLYQMGISAIGGVSGGMLALGFLIMFGSDAVISFFSTIISMIV